MKTLHDKLDELLIRAESLDSRLTNLEQRLGELAHRPTVFFEPVWCQRCGLEPCQCPVVCEPMHVIPGEPTHVIPGYTAPTCGYTAPAELANRPTPVCAPIWSGRYYK